MPTFKYAGPQKSEVINGRAFHVTNGFTVTTKTCPGPGWEEVKKAQKADDKMVHSPQENKGAEHAAKPHSSSKSHRRTPRQRRK